ncbi:hypothetical protein CXF72_13330 [Psychromonas sp. MB-3u-54]|uniref:hypothetical protein n=1 Tax=Psychromonas sp. MB-3u-54 TaxID=2058319 RepID=UPI000C324D6A|nr:hypothetical protein [Psychromonas sp. MB-3u-54]PKH02093.1 hypothetical protein CXF72_13330 [Psychromonas sp. MB-3u-54]
MNNKGIQIPRAIHKLFGVEIAKYKSFKDLIYPLVRSGFISHYKEPIQNSDKNTIFITYDQLDKLYNAVLLQSIFPDSKTIKSIFENKTVRADKAKAIRLLLQDRQSIAGIGLLSAEVERFVTMLESDSCLSQKRLPNPYVELPQLSFTGITNLMQALLVQSAALSVTDSMLAHYLSGNLEKSWELSKNIEPILPIIQDYKMKIDKEYKEALEFDKLLDDLIS